MKGIFEIEVVKKINTSHPHFVTGQQVTIKKGERGTANFDHDTNQFICWFPVLKTPTHNWPVPLSPEEIEVVK